MGIIQIVILIIGGICISIGAGMLKDWLKIKKPKTFAYFGVGLVVIGATLSIILNFPKKEKNNKVSDQFLSVYVANPAVGTILSKASYEIQLEIKNESMMRMEITRITVQSINEEAAALFSKPDPQVFEADMQIHYSLSGNESQIVPVKLNQILPAQLNVIIYHNRANKPSEFRLDVAGRVLPMPSAQYLSRTMIYSSYSSLDALKKGRMEALKWKNDAQLVAMFPGTNKTIFDTESRLEFVISDEWVTTFYSKSVNKIFVAIISPTKIKEQRANIEPEKEYLPHSETPELKLGFEQALDLANRASLISADWNGPNFQVVQLFGGPASAWFLPYLAPNGMPVIIDAVTGDQLVHAGSGFYKRIQIFPTPVAN